MSTVEDLFHPVIELPDEVRAERYRRLVGLDDIKDQLKREALLITDPYRLRTWAIEHHGAEIPALALFRDRAPLFVFAGDVGTGKSALAESFGCDLAETLDVPTYLYRLKLTARGTGLVGEMTTLIGDAFTFILGEGRKARGKSNPKSVLVVVVDEADALGQSRAAEQMHHEDRAGVDALLAGVDSLTGEGLPVVVVMCTNRLMAMDPAITRRAAAIFSFGRPSDEQRRAVLTEALAGVEVEKSTIERLVQATGRAGSSPGFTYSDLTQRLIPQAIMSAFPDRPLTGEILLATLNQVAATPEFASAQS